ncbi:putative GAG-pre-integrase domain-containing protein [Helianthus annuus]|uniref:GAG-pre-integrase domain-containing protein n=1 Tax=Helianthus annuus TaxID=4232 RepID=A0A9K3P1Q9_HELAN|nr:putative GAG-pre-integrase domain-containing protein [Helianthus annuus]KAJ0956376.1 putative GAG-pre-integrase domain-containing protein [Helianthus annuus]
MAGYEEHCDLCNRDGHNRSGCFKIIGYPEWWPGKAKDEKTKPKVAFGETGSSEDGPSPIEGLNNNQYNQFLNLFNMENSPNVQNTQPIANMAEKGNEWIADSGCTDHIDLNSRRLIGMGKCKGGLYHMKMEGNKRKAMAVSGEVWHQRLGHPSHSKISCLDFLSSNSNNVHCDSCLKAKFTRLPFPDSYIKSKECFDLLHCDIWGKYRRPSLTRANYFLTIVVTPRKFVFNQ